jgi:hypothetical protein
MFASVELSLEELVALLGMIYEATHDKPATPLTEGVRLKLNYGFRDILYFQDMANERAKWGSD